MKPWPAAIRSRYPVQGDPIRPWWSGVKTNQRSDRDFNLGPWLEAATSVAEARAKIDRNYPIQHPGFRAGQVWGDEHGNAVVLLSVSWNGHWKAVCDATDRDAEWTPVLSEFPPPNVYPYLIADPCCPWLAPWSSP